MATWVVVALLACLAQSTGASDSIVANWNRATAQALLADGADVTWASHVMALVNVAMYDAVTSITEQNEPFGYSVAATSIASVDAAALGAAYSTLLYLYPSQAAQLNAQYDADLSKLNPNATTTTEGLNTGSAVAAALIYDRNATVAAANFPASSLPGAWRPTPPTFAAAEAPQWGSARTWCIANASTYLAPVPPDLASAGYVGDHNEIFLLGRRFNSTRSAAQTASAAFWSAQPNPVLVWNDVAVNFVVANKLSISSATRLLTVLSLAQADAAIASWQALYGYARWRPITAVRWANTTANPALAFDPDWQPLGTTPNWPEYASDTAVLAGVASEILTQYFGSLGLSTATSITIGSRTYSTPYAAALEQAQSQVYSGLNFNSSCTAGLQLGAQVADWVFSNCAQPVPPDNTAVIAGSIIGSWLALTLVLAVVLVIRRERTSRH